MSILDPLAALAVIALAVLLVDALTHHWLTELILYVILTALGAFTSIFVYGGVIDLIHTLKSRWTRWRSGT